MTEVQPLNVRARRSDPSVPSWLPAPGMLVLHRDGVRWTPMSARWWQLCRRAGLPEAIDVSWTDMAEVSLAPSEPFLERTLTICV